MTIAFQTCCAKHPNRQFLVLDLIILTFAPNFSFGKNRGCRFQIWEYSFQFPVQKLPNKSFLDRDLRTFIFARNFAFKNI